MANAFRLITPVLCLLAALTVATSAHADDDHANPFDNNSSQDSSTSGSFFGLFGSDETELSEFKRPSDGYGENMARRPEAIRLQNARGSGLIEEPETEAYVNGVLAKILAANGFGDLAPRVYLHADLDAQAVATPDGGIFINIGLMHALRTETELAFLLAHEVSHFLLEHHGADWFVETQSRMLTGVETLQTIGNGIASRVGESDSAMGEKLQKATQIGAVIYDVSDNIFFSAWGREQEEEADHLGLDLMVGAGYYPFDAEGVLEILAQQEALQERNQEASKALLNTRSAEAFGLNEDEISSNPLLSGVATGLGEMISELSSDHYPAEERSEDMFDYNEKHYSDVEPGLEVAVPWVTKENHPLNVIVENYKHASRALDLLAEGALKQGERAARKAVTGITSNHAYPRVAFQRVRRAQGNARKAEQNLQLAQRGDTVPLLVYYEYIDLQNQKGAFTGILDLVTEAERTAGGELPQFLPYAVYALRALRQNVEAFDLQKSCEIDHPEMQRPCKRAARGEYPGTLPVKPKRQEVNRDAKGLPWRQRRS